MARKRPGRKAGGGEGTSGGAGNNRSNSGTANANANASAPATAETAAAPPPPPSTSSSTSSLSAAASRQQPKPIPSSFEAARTPSQKAAEVAAAADAAVAAAAAAARTATAAAAAPQQGGGGTRQQAGANPPPQRRLSATRPGSGYEGTLSAGPSELAGYADGAAGGVEEEEEEEEAAADPERATAASAANGNHNNNASSSHQHHHHGAASVSTTIVTLLSLQLGWGLWLLPADFARLGWAGAGITVAVVSLLTAYSASLFPRLVAAVEGAVLFGDVGEAAAGRRGRAAVYAIIYTLDASRCVVLHLAATQALQHAAGNPKHFAEWHFGLLVALLSLALAQARNLAHMSKLLAAGTAAQLFAVSVVMATLVAKPDRSAPPTRLFEHHGWVRTSVAVLNVFFAYGGQFAFTEVIVSMRRPARFARAAGAATAVMTLAYSTLGAVGYASRGARVHEIVIFALGEGPWERAAAGAVLLQALAQYLVNVNVWVHNLLVLLSRAREEARRGGGGRESASASAAEEPLLPSSDGGGPRTAADHARGQWALATLFVVSYSFAISMSLPFFSSLVGLLVAGTYLAAAYALPCWFALKLLLPRGLLSGAEAAWCRFLIGGSGVVSAVGLAASVSALVNNIGGGPAK